MIFDDKFMIEELVKRDFKKKYKGTFLGMAWSMLAPLFTLLIMRVVFTHFFGTSISHYTTYLFCGNLIYSYFSDSTTTGMNALLDNAGIYTKINVPKYYFLISKNLQSLINFSITLVVFFVFCFIDNITFTFKMLTLIYPLFFLFIFNFGVSLILSALYVFFRDMQYLWSVFLQLLMYCSAIFYDISTFSEKMRKVFYVNPVYLFIRYFRKVVIEGIIPSFYFHLLIAFDTLVVLLIGFYMYRHYNQKFLYYV